jgi:chromosome segregation ATPase
MTANKKIFSFLLLLLVTFLTGCQDMSSANNTNVPPAITSANRFQEPAKSPTAVDAAVQLAQEHAKVLEENNSLKQQIQILTAQNDQLKKQVAALEPELKQAKKELNQANDFLVDMTTELNNWKVQILGYQDEMRQSNKAEMQMLIKIAQAMGAEVTTTDQSQQHKNQPPAATTDQNDKLSQPSKAGDAND